MSTDRLTTATAGPDLGTSEVGGPNPRCFWDESVCSRTPEYVIVEPVGAPDDEVASTPDADAATYCPRHYVLTLSRLLEVHLPQCSGTARDHVLRYGRI